MPVPASTPKKVVQVVTAVASLGAVPVVYVVAVAGVAIVGGGCLIYYYWYHRDSNKQPAPTPVSVPLDNIQTRPHTSVRQRLNVNGFFRRRRIPHKSCDPREVGRNPEPETSSLNAVSGEQNEILRYFANQGGDSTDQLTGIDQHPAASSSAPIRFAASPESDLSEIGSLSPANFVSPSPRSPPYLFHT